MAERPACQIPEWKYKNEKTNLVLSVFIDYRPAIISAMVAMTLLLLLSNIIFNQHMAYAHHIIDQIPIPSRPMGLSLSSSSSSSANNSQLLYVSNFGLPVVSIINTTSNNGS